MIQDIYPHQFFNTFKKVSANNNDRLCIIYEDKILIEKKDNNEIQIPQAEMFPEFENLNFTFLFRMDNENYFLKILNKEEFFKLESKKFKELTFEERRFFRHANPKYVSFAAINALQLNAWYLKNVFCGKCGKRTIHDSEERMIKCPDCGNMIYPKISPAVIVGITNKDSILLTKYNHGPTANYALVAGFNEFGETLEETVQREVFEEVGLKVKNISYYKSQPWAFTETLLAGFFCEVEGETAITLETEELSFGKWFKRNEIPVKPNDLSLTNEMIIYFSENKIFSE